MKKLSIKINKRQLFILQNVYKTDIEIAKYLGVTRQYIHLLRKKFNVPIFKSTKIKDDRNKLIYSAFVKGVKRSELAKKMNITYTTVCRIIDNLKPTR
jgi:Mor family transcriptional regulator